MNQPLTQQRLRIRFGQDGPLRFVGHHDLARTWERVLRRAEAPLEYSQGFTPRPRMQFAAALPIGASSEYELLDAWMTARLEPLDEWKERFQATSPQGLTVLALDEVPINEAALPTLITHASYTLMPVDPSLTVDLLEERVAALLSAEKIERERHNSRLYDLRPLIRSLSVAPDGTIHAELVTGNAGAGRVDELVDALGLSLVQLRAHRTRLYLTQEAATNSATQP